MINCQILGRATSLNHVFSICFFKISPHFTVYKIVISLFIVKLKLTVLNEHEVNSKGTKANFPIQGYYVVIL